MQNFLQYFSSLYRVFPQSVEGSTEWANTRVPQAPREAPDVDPDTSVSKVLSSDRCLGLRAETETETAVLGSLRTMVLETD